MPYMVRRGSVLLMSLAVVVAACEQTTEPPPTEEIPWELMTLSGVNSSGVAVGTATRFVPVPGTDSAVQQYAGAVWRMNADLQVVEAVTSFVDMNDAGHAVGFLAQDGGVTLARLWTGSTIVELGEFVPVAVGNSNDVVGYVGEGNARTGLLRRSTGAVESLATVRDVASHSTSLVIPLDIANGPVVVGAVGITSEAFVWSPNEGARLIFPDRGNAESDATAINANGDIVGWSSAFRTAFIARPGEEVRALEPLATSPSNFWARARAHDITDSGLVVGESLTAGYSPRAVKWLPDGTIVDLGPGRAVAASETGYIVGHNLGGGANHPVVWLPSGTRVDLVPSTASAVLQTGSRIAGSPCRRPC